MYVKYKLVRTPEISTSTGVRLRATMIGVVGVLASLLSKWINAVHDGDADTEFILPDKKKQKSRSVKEEVTP